MNVARLLTITIYFKSGLKSEDLKIRYILCDTIEDRGLGSIINEGSGENYIDVSVLVDENEHTKESITSILQSLGLLEQSKLSWEDFEN